MHGAFTWLRVKTPEPRPALLVFFLIGIFSARYQKPCSSALHRPTSVLQDERQPHRRAGHETEPMRSLRREIRPGFAQLMEPAFLLQTVPAGSPSRERPSPAL